MFSVPIRSICCIALVGLLGCNSSQAVPDHFKTAPVTGTLTYQDKPLPDFLVVFTPTDSQRPARGRTDASGKFTLGTNEPGDGAPIALCKVSVAFDPDQEVDSALAGSIDDPSKLPKPAIAIPAKYNNPETSELTIDVPADGLKDYKLELK